MEMIQECLLIAFLIGWLLICAVILIATIQGIVNDHKREKREKEADARDLEYHEKRMKFPD